MTPSGGSSTPQSIFTEEKHTCTITNLASDQCDFVPTLDGNGFAVCTLPSVEVAFTNEIYIQTGYYKEIEAFLLQHCSATRVQIFDHTIRRPGTNRGPIPRTHVDQTTKGSAIANLCISSLTNF